MIVEDLGRTSIDKDCPSIALGRVTYDQVAANDGGSAFHPDPAAGVVTITSGDDKTLDRRPGSANGQHPTSTLSVQCRRVGIWVGWVGKRGIVAAAQSDRLGEHNDIAHRCDHVGVGVDAGCYFDSITISR